MDASTKKCIFVLGPTGSGKSAWALEQAIKYNGSIVNIDSIQFYKDLVVGAATPSKQEQQQAPHYLYSYVEAPQVMTAGQYIEDFYELLKKPEIKFPLFIVGGTGFYIQALEKGMHDVEPVPVEVRSQIEAELAAELEADENATATKLYQELLAKDPQTKIHINDHYRLVRALEIIRFTGKVPSQLNNEKPKNIFPYDYIKVGFDFAKEDYLPRIQKRTQAMIQNGIIGEVEALLKKNQQDWLPLQSVGYKQTLEFVTKVKSEIATENKDQKWLAEAIDLATMQLIKKQKTWFKRDSAILWSNQSEELLGFISKV